MIAISLWQPWATALVLEFPDGVPLKPDETRHWNLPPRCVGVPVAIHAALRVDKTCREAWRSLTLEQRDAFAAAHILSFEELPRGALVGHVVFSTATPTADRRLHDRLVRSQRLLGNYDAGRFAWPTSNRLRWPAPIPTVGRQGFFNVPVDLSA